jgi:hypothetical protein
MRMEFNRTGTERKALVTAIGEILSAKPKYMGMPSAAYEINYFTVTKDGALEFDDRTDSEEVENLLERLAERGIAAGTTETAQAWLDAREEEVCERNANKPQEAVVGLTVEIPFEKVAVGNLTKLLEAKGRLIKKALCLEELPMEMGEDRIFFPWFAELPDAETVKAYTHLISALCEMSRNQKRITSKENEVTNEKYAFRCFLLRLGFIGTEYKEERKILLQNLSGSSAFKGGAKNEVDG